MRFPRCHRVFSKASATCLAGLLTLGIVGTFVQPAFAKAVKADAKVQAALAPTERAQQLADWVLDSGDNGDLPFLIIDKSGGKAFVFARDGHSLGSAWVLTGLAPGDNSLPGIGTMPLSAIKPEMRTTPAGRFTAILGHDLEAEVLWVDYPDAISMHPVINTTPSERRLQRIVSPKASDHRISFGCINVPPKFFSGVVKPALVEGKGIVYILPDMKPLPDVFPKYYDAKPPADAAAPQRSQALVAPDGVN
jgi:hypothetical protein